MEKYKNEAIIGNKQMLVTYTLKGELQRMYFPAKDNRQYIDFYHVGVKINDSNLIYLHDDINNVYKQYYGKKQIAFLRDESYSQYQKADFLQDATPVPVQSSRPDIIDTIYVLPTTFSIIPIEQQHIDPNGLFMDFDLRKGDNRLTHGTAKNYHLIGALKEHNYLSFFSLQHNDAWYLVIPAVEDDVTHLAIPVIDNGKQVKVDITCNTTQP